MAAYRIDSIDISLEEKIITGLIVSTDYISIAGAMVHPHLFQSQFSQYLARWCLDFHAQYRKAPGKHIQDIFDGHVRTGKLEPATADLIEKFLARLSSEYEQGAAVNPEYLKTQTEQYFNERRAIDLSQTLQLAIEQKLPPEEIDRLLEEHAQTRVDGRADFAGAFQTSTDLMAQKIKIPRPIISPWLSEKSLNMVYSSRGIGKTWFALILAVSITRENYKDISIGSWYVKNPCSVLYIDGEMGKWILQKRIRQIAEPLGPESKRFPLITFSTPDYSERSREAVNIMRKEWQERIYTWLAKNRSIKLMVLDNLAALGAGREENSNQEASLFNSWLIRIRALGVAVLEVHHAGKSGLQRGASSLEDPLDCSILLSHDNDWNIDDGCAFKVDFKKARNNEGGKDFRSFNLQLIEHSQNSKWRRWVES